MKMNSCAICTVDSPRDERAPFETSFLSKSRASSNSVQITKEKKSVVKHDSFFPPNLVLINKLH